jgi:hypothetical protein
MQDMFAREPVKTPQLVKEIVQAADGVFLWVYLVVVSLLKGLGNCDEVLDLQRKLRLLPKDLKQLYIYMIKGVDEDYQEEAAQFFKLFNTTQNLDDESFPTGKKATGRSVKPMTILALCVAKEPEEEIPAMVKRYKDSYETVIPRCRDMSRRLQSRTGGLLEVQLRGAKLDQITPAMKVGYLHRTVRDFLISREARDILQAETDLDTDYAMLKSSVYELQIQLNNSEQDLGVESNRDPLYFSALIYAERCQAKSQDPKSLVSQTRLLDQLYTKTPRRWIEPINGLPNYREGNSLEYILYTAVEWRLFFYVEEKLKEDPLFPPASVKRGLLDYTLLRDSTFNPKPILALLTLGIDPFIRSEDLLNRETLMCSEQFMFFENVINTLDSRYPIQPSQLRAWGDVLRHLLSWGAFQGFREDDTRDQASRQIASIFSALPELNEELQALLTKGFSQQPKSSCCIQ